MTKDKIEIVAQVAAAWAETTAINRSAGPRISSQYSFIEIESARLTSEAMTVVIDPIEIGIWTLKYAAARADKIVAPKPNPWIDFESFDYKNRPTREWILCQNQLSIAPEIFK